MKPVYQVVGLTLCLVLGAQAVPREPRTEVKMDFASMFQRRDQEFCALDNCATSDEKFIRSHRGKGRSLLEVLAVYKRTRTGRVLDTERR
ncbi:unnamed protein product [Zymoseptoria tritici ST99CH_3D1]|nr:unnamed protein product [Zymoseptoria tritici ST99CH_3D1]